MVLVFLVLIVSQWNFSLGSASIIKAKSGKRKDFETCAGSELEKTNLESSIFRVVNLDNFFTSFSQIEHPKKCPTGWWFSGYFLFSSRNLGEIFIPFDLRICFEWVFSRNLATNHPQGMCDSSFRWPVWLDSYVWSGPCISKSLQSCERFLDSRNMRQTGFLHHENRDPCWWGVLSFSANVW